jgi:hypothetical protein
MAFGIGIGMEFIFHFTDEVTKSPIDFGGNWQMASNRREQRERQIVPKRRRN